jgi:hypothetical protein
MNWVNMEDEGEGSKQILDGVGNISEIMLTGSFQI